MIRSAKAGGTPRRVTADDMSVATRLTPDDGTKLPDPNVKPS
jgi:hypothetical protein